MGRELKGRGGQLLAEGDLGNHVVVQSKKQVVGVREERGHELTYSQVSM